MTGVDCAWMRGGTSKGAFFRAEDLPADIGERDDFLLSVMGSPHERQIDGIGGGHPLTSKVAVVSVSDDPRADVDYLFLQVAVETAEVSDRQNCGNLLAAVGPFAVERGLIAARGEVTEVRVRLVNTGGYATVRVNTPGGVVDYRGDTAISGVPGTAAPISLEFADTAGSTCGSLLPTGSARDTIDGITVSCVDNGMPVVVLRAADLGVTGGETPAELEADEPLRQRLERIRLSAGISMGLGDVTAATVPKMTLIAPPRNGGTVLTRSFIPHRCHTAIGVLAAVSVATACALPDGIAWGATGTRHRVEHPTGHLEVDVALAADGSLERSGVVRTARLLFDGRVFPA